MPAGSRTSDSQRRPAQKRAIDLIAAPSWQTAWKSYIGRATNNAEACIRSSGEKKFDCAEMHWPECFGYKPLHYR